MKVVVTDYIEQDLDWEQEHLAELGIEFEAHQLKFAPEEELAAATQDADVIVVNMAPITEALVARWQKCRMVIRHGIGYDNVNVDALTARGIMFVNEPDYCVEEVAEQTAALYLALARKIVSSRGMLEQSIKLGRWNFDSIMPLHRIQGRKLGIIGCGRIGSRVYQKMRGFGLEFLICDPYMSERRKSELDIEVISLRSLLEQADAVSLHMPLNDETRGLINAETLGWMKPEAFIINTARAGLIDQPALVEALRAGRIAGAGLDVYYPEPPHADDPLLTMPNVILTPHIAWCSEEAGWQIRKEIVSQIVAFQQGREPANLINPAVLQTQELS
jgi:D-3-phosphoglycerate dehydrogenase